jgi:hypothetical protein
MSTTNAAVSKIIKTGLFFFAFFYCVSGGVNGCCCRRLFMATASRRKSEGELGEDHRRSLRWGKEHWFARFLSLYPSFYCIYVFFHVASVPLLMAIRKSDVAFQRRR